MKRLTSEYQDREIPLPDYWGGYRLTPSVIEFWQNRPGRLHDRFRYTRQSDGQWLIERLSP
jgi:pyridoxamine 5'-phosphate oxidase